MDAVILAAGIGSRMKQNYPKQFIEIGGKPMFIYSLEVLRLSKHIDNIILTCNKLSMDLYEKYINEFHIDNVKCIVGGEIRQQSVYLALKLVESEKVLIHEAARPLISVDFVDSIINSYLPDAVIPTIPVSFSIIEGDKTIEKELTRDRMKNVQLPQVFNTKKLLDAHSQSIIDNYSTTEDGMLLFHYGGTVNLVNGRESNIKITTPLDLEIVEKLLKLA